MTSTSEHARNVLGAILPGRDDLLAIAQRHLELHHFQDQILRNIYTYLERYADATAGALPGRDALAGMLRRQRCDTGLIAAYLEHFDELVERSVDDGAFRWSLQELREQAAERATGDALTQAMEILKRGADDEHGNRLVGQADAREHVLAKLAEIDRGMSLQSAPEGELRGEGKDVLADYAASKAARLQGHTTGIEFGIPALDAKVGGFVPGNLGLIVGYTSEGKTNLCVQLAWNASVNQHKNVVFFTTETPYKQVRRRLIARHSCWPEFGQPDGLDSKAIKDGTLDTDGESLLARVTDDWDHNPSHGHCYIVQVPQHSGMGYIESKLTRISRMYPVDLALMDYFALLKSDRPRQSDREELSSILKHAKQITTTFNDGHGIALVSPWQVSRTARMEAEKTGAYTSNALSETSEASNSPDIIVSLLAPIDNDKRHARLKMQVMKNRDGERANTVQVDIDYATSRFTDEGTAQRSISQRHHGGAPDPLLALIGEAA